jgi:hypothetical protein
MAELDTDHNWYALYTRHQHEKAAAGTLQKKGFEIFLPLYTTDHRWQDRIKQVSLPLFPCYIFLRGGLNRWLQIMTTPGVCGIVGFGAPAAIPTSEIEGVRRMVETNHQHVAAGMCSGTDVNGPSLQMGGFTSAEGLLHLCQILIARVHHLLGGGALREVGLENVTAVQTGSFLEGRRVHDQL